MNLLNALLGHFGLVIEQRSSHQDCVPISDLSAIGKQFQREAEWHREAADRKEYAPRVVIDNNTDCLR